VFNLPLLCGSSREDGGIGADRGVVGGGSAIVPGLVPGYHAHPAAALTAAACPLNIRSLSYTESAVGFPDCCSFWAAKFRRTRLMDETCMNNIVYFMCVSRYIIQFVASPPCHANTN